MGKNPCRRSILSVWGGQHPWACNFWKCQAHGRAEDLYMDGTFKITPWLFHQVCTVHAFKHGWQFPLLYCFLPGQTRQVYSQCLGHHGQCFWLAVSSATSEYGCDRFRTGHSLSCGWKSQWDIGQGCFFYFVQAVRRQVQHLRLQSLYKTNATFNKFIFKLLAQSLCPVSYVWLAWISAAPPNTHNQAVAILCQYFEDTWLDGSYRLSMWNHYSNESA